ncbi:hypothetical protein K456DRAFT_1664593 [Colletotrichum gloeosporioides 23]|nr:hypothetical protein K456DRAFT_1664593 [Colletotrichum gloeosporioides 23]
MLPGYAGRVARHHVARVPVSRPRLGRLGDEGTSSVGALTDGRPIFPVPLGDDDHSLKKGSRESHNYHQTCLTSLHYAKETFLLKHLALRYLFTLSQGYESNRSIPLQYKQIMEHGLWPSSSNDASVRMTRTDRNTYDMIKRGNEAKGVKMFKPALSRTDNVPTEVHYNRTKRTLYVACIMRLRSKTFISGQRVEIYAYRTGSFHAKKDSSQQSD